MKVLIVGSGAVGGYFGAMLHRAGHDVTFLARGENLQAIERQGLRIESSNSGSFTIHPRAVERLDGSWKAELALFCVKGYDNLAAIDAMRPAIGVGSSVLTLQNGIGSGDELAAEFGSDAVLLGVTYIDATRRGPAVVAELGGSVDIIYGDQEGQRTPRARFVQEELDVPGIDVTLSRHIAREVWTKLVYICGLSGMTCITRASFAEVLDMPETLELTERVLREVEAVARAKRVTLGDGIVEETMERYQSSGRDATSSMYTDLVKGNRLEVGVLNGAVSRFGSELGVATPANDFITACLTVAHNRAAAAGTESKGG